MGIFDAICRKRIAIAINLIRLRVTGSRSLVRAHHKGAPGSLDAVCALGPWDPPRQPSAGGGFSVPGGPTLSSRHDDGYETIVASIGLSLGRESGQGRRSYKEMRNLNRAFGVASKVVSHPRLSR